MEWWSPGTVAFVRKAKKLDWAWGLAMAVWLCHGAVYLFLLPVIFLGGLVTPLVMAGPLIIAGVAFTAIYIGRAPRLAVDALAAGLIELFLGEFILGGLSTSRTLGARDWPDPNAIPTILIVTLIWLGGILPGVVTIKALRLLRDHRRCRAS